MYTIRVHEKPLVCARGFFCGARSRYLSLTSAFQYSEVSLGFSFISKSLNSCGFTEI